MKIKRSIFNKLLQQNTDRKLSILVGPRQVGKTFLMRALQKELEHQGLKCAFFDLEQPNDLLSLGSTEKEQFDKITNSGQVVFIDEFHLLKNISKLFKALYDSSKKIKIFASGSSALEMHEHLQESMAGRVIFNRIYPLTIAEKEQLKTHSIDEHLRFGGLPGLLQSTVAEEKIDLLQSMVATYIQKDIKALVKEENIRAFNHLIALLAEHQGSVVTSASLSREIRLSQPSIERYLEILSQTYVCHALPSFAHNLSNELKKSKKYYLYDLGVRNSIIKDFRELTQRTDAGVLRESFVYLSILPQLKANMEVRFWRTKQGHEVDFILLKNKIPFPVEVKSTLSDPEIPAALRSFLDHYQDAPGAIVFNENIETDISYKNKIVRFLKHEKAEQIPYLLDVL